MAADPAAPVTIAQLDAQLVERARPAARRPRSSRRRPRGRPDPDPLLRHRDRRAPDRPARQPPGRQDALELGPGQRRHPRRGRVLGRAHPRLHRRRGRVGRSELAATFQLPALTPLQRDVLQTAIGLVGYPYIWGGTSERPQDPFGTGKRVPGGFDCSGFAWRVYKLQAYTGARRARRDAEGPDDLRDERRGAAREADPAREAPAGRPPVLRRRAGRSRSRARSTTWACTSATAGSSSRPTRASRSRR